MKRRENGSGTMRQRPDGRWEARVTLGRNPKTGGQLQKSVYGKTQKEAAHKMRQLLYDFNMSDDLQAYDVPLSEWLKEWSETYILDLKPLSIQRYRGDVNSHIIPALGAVKLQKLTTPMIQSFITQLINAKGLKAISAHRSFTTLRTALSKAVSLGYLVKNPCKGCVFPREPKKEMKILSDNEIPRFLDAIRGHMMEQLFITTLFTGLRRGEVLGLTWDCVDFQRDTITVEKQLIYCGSGKGVLDTPKNGKKRVIKVARLVMDCLKSARYIQTENKLKAGPVWSNPLDLVFTNETGCNFSGSTVDRQYRAIINSIGCPGVRFHDLRHSYAVMSIQNGDDIKTVQENLGHHSAAFTLDVYGHVTARMKDASAERMNAYIEGLKKA